MSTLRWSPEQLAAHTAKLRKAIESAPIPVGPICTPRKAAQEDAKNRTARAMLDAVATAKPGRQKYGNKITTDADGTKHASKKQALRYRDLGLLMKSGEILMLAREVRFRLPGNVQYVADHVFANQRAIEVMAGLVASGDLVIEDVKSTATRVDKVFRVKAKQMRECLGLPVTEV